MKKIKNVVFVLLLFFAFNGCDKNPIEEQQLQTNSELTVNEAKAFVEAQHIDQISLKSGDTKKPKISIRANWNKTKKSSNDEVSVVETEIEAMGLFGFSTPECMEQWQTSKNGDYLIPMTRLVVIKLKKTGEMYSFFMSIAADRQYIENKKGNLWKNFYLRREQDFSGYILFHDLSGNFVNGWIYCDGQITNSIIQASNIDLQTELKSAQLVEVIYTWEQECTDYYSVSSVNGEVISIKYMYTSCTDVLVSSGTYTTGGGGSSSGSSGGGTDGGYNPPASQPCSCTNICPVCGKCLDTSNLKSAALPDGSTSTTTTTTDPCDYCTGHPEPVPAPVPVPPSKPIVSILDYLMCIDQSSSATITIYVDQPVANSSTPYNWTDVGHSFIGISQGSNISVFGFYPDGLAKPTSTNHESALGDDSSHSFDVSVSKTVSSTQLSAILNYVINRPPTYDLNSFNCTDFAINVGNMAGMNLPDTQGSWPGGGGSNPGNLGQDIRNMSLASGMSRNASAGTSPSNVQSCPH